MTVALLEVLDRDGQVRQSVAVAAWPLRVGRALDNDVVLSDPNVAAHHFTIGPASQALAQLPQLAPLDDSVELRVGETRNGVQLGAQRLRAGDTAAVPQKGEAVELSAGRTRLRLRLPQHQLAPEMPLAALATRRQRVLPVLAGALLLTACLVFNTYLNNDPDTLSRALGGTLAMAVMVTAGWCSAWALLSKTFTRQAHFGWHLRVFLTAAIALLAVDALPSLVAFSLSWPWVSDFAFIATIAVGASALYFHLLAVEPARHKLLKGVAVVGALVAVALSLWFNQQRADQYGVELYMHHLFPPALRLARPVASDAFIGGLSTLKPVLDRKAREKSNGDDAGEGANDDE